MKLSVDFEGLERVRQRLGAPLSSWSPNHVELAPREALRKRLTEGIELDFEEIEVSEGLFHHRGEQIVIYIKDHTTSMSRRRRGSGGSVLTDPGYGKKVHLCECNTIQTMRRERRFGRYVATNRTSGMFEIDVINPYSQDEETREAALHVCTNCIRNLDLSDTFKKDPGRSDLKGNFDFEAFFQDFSVYFVQRPRHSASTAPPSGYVQEWASISSRVRSQANWTCSEPSCRVNLSAPGDRKWLHTHHVNGLRSDNSPGNLKPLCVVCHAAQPGHSHMHVPQEARARVTSLRRRAS